MKFDFNFCIEHILSSEGGFTKNPNDKGNWTGGQKGKGILNGTKWGISAASYPDLDIPNLTRSQAIALYFHDFWLKFKVESYPERLRLHFFDVCINSGNSRAVKMLQRAAGITADGDAGPQTMKAAVSVDIWEYHNERNDFYVIYADQNSDQMEFLKGWIRRVSKVTQISIVT